MNRQSLIGLAFTLAALAGCASAPDGPEAAIKALYAPYLAKETAGSINFAQLPAYSKAMKAEIDRGLQYGVLLNEPVIDYDPIANAQETNLSKLVVTAYPIMDGRAHAVAEFDNFDSHTLVIYDLIQEDGAWRIDGIKSGEEDLHGIIELAIAPQSDGEAMKSPIQQIYEMYSPPHNGASAPLHRWAPLSKSFQMLMEEADTKVIGFDPVTDGTDVNQESVTMEPAGSAVIVRIGESGSQHVIVYDVVEEDGDWKVWNIRGPLAARPWDVQLILSDAGIKAP